MTVVNNSVSGNCYGNQWREETEPLSIGNVLQTKGGYQTFYAGKYLNRYGKTKARLAPPPGWNWWAGLVGNSKYYNYTLSVNGKAEYHKGIKMHGQFESGLFLGCSEQS